MSKSKSHVVPPVTGPFTNESVLRDTLGNCGMDCVFSSYLEDVRPSIAYARGITAGMVSAFIATGMTYQEALAKVKDLTSHLHEGGCTGAFSLQAIPEAWQEDFKQL